MNIKKITRCLANIIFFFCPVTAIAVLIFFFAAEVWPVHQRAFAGKYIYSANLNITPRDEIFLSENGTYQRNLVAEGRNELMLTGKWYLISTGWKGIRGRDIRLESPTQFKSIKADSTQYKDDFLMPQQFAVLSHWGQVQGLNLVKEYTWMKVQDE